MGNAYDHDLLILGGGPAGLVIASVAAQLGLSVALIEKSGQLGGDCLHTGCVPSKALLSVAAKVHAARSAGRYGLYCDDQKVDFSAVMADVREAIDRILVHDDPERFRAYGCRVEFGAGRFVDAHTVAVLEEEKERLRLTAKRIVIATGAEAVIPPVPGLDPDRILTHKNLFSLTTQPKRLAVLGAGPIGIEMAQAFNRLGSEVHLIEMEDAILPMEDPDLTTILQDALQAEGVRCHLGAGLAGVRHLSDGHQLTLGDDELTVDAILIATGQRPMLDGVNLAAAGVDFDHRTGVRVDARLRSSQKHIFAAGDVAGPLRLTHVAEHHAGVVLANAVFHFPKKVNLKACPRVIYGDPELASVGMTKQQANDWAREQGKPLETVDFPLHGFDRAVTDRREEGQLRLLVSGKRLLGATLVSPHAGELIHELALVIQQGLPLSAIRDTIHAYPTMSQAHQRGVGRYYSPSLFSSRTRRLVRWLNRLF